MVWCLRRRAQHMGARELIMSLELVRPELTELKPRITVIGVGGAGGNALDNMIQSGLKGVDFVVANTDAQERGLDTEEARTTIGRGSGRGSESQYVEYTEGE